MSNFDNNNNGGSSPPQDNPILTAFESYQKDTPFITRTIMSAQAVSYVVNKFFDTSFAFANKPVFTIYKYEVYRIITSLFICSSFFSLIFHHPGSVLVEPPCVCFALWYVESKNDDGGIMRFRLG